MKRAGKILPKALRYLFSKPATVAYPAAREDLFDDFRGKLAYAPESCIGCKICVRDCPTGAIEIEKVADKEYKALLSLDRCVFCGQCVDSCPKDSLSYTSEFELAGLSRGSLRVEL
jgi:formate hydrogenlyase subunit 6/NADH:ubiquinone oxidoreductase subunit I